uniref:Uncharacterized protein n=1 Tax=Nelumbo nucifera TaxID=4432 RepID=A0A822ZGU1_NELNU|nr:TPA_asm: hypothetical protein HUJ06_000919 [Nelumbo nucifera]
MDHYFLDIFLSDHDLISPAISMKPKQAAETMLKSPWSQSQNCHGLY